MLRPGKGVIGWGFAFVVFMYMFGWRDSGGDKQNYKWVGGVVFAWGDLGSLEFTLGR